MAKKEKKAPESAETPAGEPEQSVSAEQPSAPEAPEIPEDARNMAMLCHLLGLVGFMAPLIIWLLKKDEHKFVDEHGTAALNYHVSIIIYYAVSWVLCFIAIGIPMLLALVVMHIIFVILATVKAKNGEPYRYPIAIRFLK